MKHFITLMILASLSSFAFASSDESLGESATDCPQMREQNERNNPKANLGDVKSQTKRTKQATAQ